MEKKLSCSPNEELVYLGKLGKTRGLKGQVYCYTDGPDQDFFFQQIHKTKKIDQLTLFLMPKDFWEHTLVQEDVLSIYRFAVSSKLCSHLEQWISPACHLQWMAHQKEYLLTFQQYQSPESAQSLVGKRLYGFRSQFSSAGIDRDIFAPTDLWGFTAGTDQALSVICDCYYNGAGQLIYCLESGAEFLHHSSFIQEINWQQRQVLLSRQWENLPGQD